MSEQQFLVNDIVDRLRLLNIKGEVAVHPVTGEESAIIDASHAEIAQQAGLATWSWQEHLGLCLSGAIRRAAGAFVNRRRYDLYSLRLGEFSPVVLSCLEDRFAAPFVAQVLRAPISEGFSVRSLSEVFRAMLEPRSVMNVDLSQYIVFAPPTGGVAPSCGIATLAKMTWFGCRQGRLTLPSRIRFFPRILGRLPKRIQLDRQPPVVPENVSHFKS